MSEVPLIPGRLWNIRLKPEGFDPFLFKDYEILWLKDRDTVMSGSFDYVRGSWVERFFPDWCRSLRNWFLGFILTREIVPSDLRHTSGLSGPRNVTPLLLD